MGVGAAIRAVGVLDELRRIVPTEQIEPDAPAAPVSPNGDESGGAWAVEPATRDELVDLMRWANDRHAAVFTRHPRPTDAEAMGPRPRIYLRGRRMRRVKDLDIVSGTLTVQSGISMRELHEILHERGMTTGFPTRPWRNESLGAILASALDAHWGPRFGAMEEQVVSVGVVFPDGRTAISRRAPRRAVGPDFDRLFLGSRGRFGIIEQATIRIYPTASRVVLSYGARDLGEALSAVHRGMERGLDPRAAEILTPAPDRSWGRKRVGLSDELPVLVLVEPWGQQAGRSVADVDQHFSELLEKLTPPAGWAVHEGLLPPPRAWVSPVVGVKWAELLHLAASLGDKIPAGLWVVRMSQHGGWLSLASGVQGEAATAVEALIAAHLPPQESPWSPLKEALRTQMDPKGILNPG